MKVDLLIAEIGSTTTSVNAFSMDSSNPRFIGSGSSNTTVLEGDVNIGLEYAIKNLCKNLGVKSLTYDEFMASSSAAGGLRMTVHGLVYDMTVRAARESALGAGGNIKLITSGKLRKSDLKKIEEVNPNIILIAGGVDYGERDTALFNSELIAELDLDIPIIYAGNVENDSEIKDLFNQKDKELYIVANVYPKIDDLNTVPTKKVIQEVFEKHIVHAKGMDKIRDMVTSSIMPTPGAVMEASILLYQSLGNLLTIDVGGATTDIDSICSESDEIGRILIRPEPFEKRTVEGDLGVYINFKNLLNLLEEDKLLKEFNINAEALKEFKSNPKPIPQTDQEIEIVRALTTISSKTALYRHVGVIKEIYGPTGKKTIAEGKDLTGVKNIILTGGALTKLPDLKVILSKILSEREDLYLLPKEVDILIDKDYIFASLGVMSKKYPQIALELMKNTLN